MIFRSPFPDVAIPSAPLAPFLLRHAERLHDKPALIDGSSGQTYTYGQLARAVRQVGANLTQRGMRQGDVFALYSPNSPEYVITVLGVWSIGGVVTTMNPLATADELAYQLKDADALYLLTAPEQMERVDRATQQAPVRERFTVVETPGATPLSTLLTSDAALPEPPIDPREDVAALLYSSGTTGLPKGVMLTHRNLIANVCQLQPQMHITEADVVINAMPFFHAAGWVILFHLGLANGCTIVTLPRFELGAFLHAAQSHGVTRTLVVPPVIVALAKQPVVDTYDLTRLTTILVGAAPLGEAVARACAERVGCLVQQIYGLTETSPITHANPEDPARNKLAAVGPCVPNTEAKVLDLASGAELGIHEPGEICVRGPQVMRGYLNRPDATALVIDHDGWFHTGDVGYADEDGYFFIVDRVKELIKYNAYQVAPAELEAVLLSHPALADAAVIPSPDEQAGEVPKAFVVLKGPGGQEADITPEAIMAYVAARVAPYKKVRRLEFIDTIPKTASGKILRRVLVARERARVAMSPPPAD
jgi:acyl-CoA synthetase (AMP-forming)/AMP-acid ligase II